MPLKAAFVSLNKALGLAPLSLPQFEGEEGVAPTALRVGAAASVSLGLSASVAAEIWRLRGGVSQAIAVAIAPAVAGLRPLAVMTRNGAPLPPPFADHGLTGFYQGADGSWLYLHGGFSGKSRLLELINAENRADAILEGVAKWQGAALEDAIAYMNLCGALSRSEEAWREQAPGLAMTAMPPILLQKVGEAPPLRLSDSAGALQGIRVLDAGCGLAGPLAASLLGGFGAEVLAVRSPRDAQPAAYAMAGGANKKFAVLDFAKPAEAEALRRTCRATDIFIDSYRPGALAKFGFTREALMHNAPGLIHVSVSAYGPVGPWARRRGFEQDVQVATGLAVEQGRLVAARSGRREALPVLIDADLCTGLAGQLAAAGAMAALLRRIREGGSWSVSVSLAGAAMWLQSLGRLEGAAVPTDWATQGVGDFLRPCRVGDDIWNIPGPAMRLDKTPLLWQPPNPEVLEKEARFLGARNDAYAA